LGVDDCEHLPIIGSIGDKQEEDGKLIGVNNFILQNIDKVEVKKGLRIFGRISKPIYRALAHTTDPFIPGVSGDESSAIQFLSEVGIELKNGEEWRSLEDLDETEKKILSSRIIMQRLNNSKNPEDIFGNVYTIKDKKDILSDVREFATLLNSCGRQEITGVGLMLVMGEETEALEIAKSAMTRYKRKLLNALTWIQKSIENNGEKVIKTKNAYYVIGEDKISDTIIGTVCSIISNNMEKDMIVGFANSKNGVKVSARSKPGLDINLGEMVTKAAQSVDGIGGGHVSASGAKIPFNKEKEFIDTFEEMIKDINAQKIADNVIGE